MSSNTIRAQAASAVLALMDDEIKYVKYRYPRNDDERSTYVAKITTDQAKEIVRALKESQKRAEQETTGGIVLNNMPKVEANTAGEKVFGVMLNRTINSTIPYQIVELLSIHDYADLDIDIDPLSLRYLSTVISDTTMCNAQEREKKAIDVVTQRVLKNTKKTQALALLGEEGVAELTAQLGLKTVDSDSNNQ